MGQLSPRPWLWPSPYTPVSLSFGPIGAQPLLTEAMSVSHLHQLLGFQGPHFTPVAGATFLGGLGVTLAWFESQLHQLLAV